MKPETFDTDTNKPPRVVFDGTECLHKKGYKGTV